MGFWSRIANLWNGFLSIFIEGIEAENPEIVYESAINARIQQFQKLRQAVSGIVYLRNKLQKELEGKSAQLTELQAQIPIAVSQGNDDAAMILIQQKNTLSAEVNRISDELAKTSKDADEAKASLISFQGEIEKLKREKETMLARREDAKARMAIQDSLSGLSTEADLKALDNVRESISHLEAQADVAKEIAGGGLDAKLKQIKDATGQTAARNELEEIRKQMQAQQNANIEKTM